jgi:hypothetical protein
MLTIKHVCDGREEVVPVVSVDYDADKNELVGASGPTHTFTTGIAYVMNERGQTVAIYNLRAGKKEGAVNVKGSNGPLVR